MLKAAQYRQKRLTERIPVEFVVEFRTKEKTVQAYVANIGHGGMCIRTSEVLPVKAQSFFRITSGDQVVNFNVEAEVMWSQPQSKIRQRRNKRPGMMGVRFVKSRFFTDDTIGSILRGIAPQVSA